MKAKEPVPIVKCFDPAQKRRKMQLTKIYHYTSPEGLKGILESNTLRFTDCQFLNDRSEFVYIRKSLEKAMEELGDQLDDRLVQAIDQQFNDNYSTEQLVITTTDNPRVLEQGTRKFRTYVFCTSIDSDSLGMWNYYVKNGNYQGYNIGFTVNRLLECFENIKYEGIKIYYGQVTYLFDEQVEILKKLLLEASQNVSKKDIEEISSESLEQLETYRLFFKDRAFKNEREFRFVLSIPTDIVLEQHPAIRTGHQIRNGIMTPCCDIKIDKKNTINGIQISPIMEQGLARQGLIDFLNKNQYEIQKEKITQSDIPIRY